MLPYRGIPWPGREKKKKRIQITQYIGDVLTDPMQSFRFFPPSLFLNFLFFLPWFCVADQTTSFPIACLSGFLLFNGTSPEETFIFWLCWFPLRSKDRQCSRSRKDYYFLFFFSTVDLLVCNRFIKGEEDKETKKNPKKNFFFPQTRSPLPIFSSFFCRVVKQGTSSLRLVGKGGGAHPLPAGTKGILLV